jgi:hypothetical protein
LIAEQGQWSRRALALELCRRWRRENPLGQLKDMAARSFLNKLHERGWIQLPPAQKRHGPGFAPPLMDLSGHQPDPIVEPLAQLRPLQFHRVRPRHTAARKFNAYLERHHYLPFRSTVGENLAYLVQDRRGRELACLLFGAAAWKIQARDRFIGWSAAQRERGLERIANNCRFLILPWVEVAHLASHLLAQAARRLAADWQSQYGHPVVLLESFVQRDRFRGTCYRAANWMCVGQTRGRTRQDPHHHIQAPIKDVWVYPLVAEFRKKLGHG